MVTDRGFTMAGGPWNVATRSQSRDFSVVRGMNGTFAGKAVLVTGAAGGLGLAVARAFRERGARVALNDLKREAIDRAAAALGGGPDVAAAPADISTAAGCRAAVEAATAAFGRLDVLVN